MREEWLPSSVKYWSLVFSSLKMWFLFNLRRRVTKYMLLSKWDDSTLCGLVLLKLSPSFVSPNFLILLPSMNQADWRSKKGNSRKAYLEQDADIQELKEGSAWVMDGGREVREWIFNIEELILRQLLPCDRDRYTIWSEWSLSFKPLTCTGHFQDPGRDSINFCL